jgi:uncharacterized protein (TIGR02466 family)
MNAPLLQARAFPLFSTPVLTERWPGAERWTKPLFDAIMERRTSHPSVSLSNVHGWQSQTDMIDWGGQAALALRDDVLARCDDFTVDVRETDRRRFVWLPEMWANVNEPGASNQSHCHPGSQWSAVYYVEDGYDGSDERSLGGEIVFTDPRMPMVRMRDPDVRYLRANGSYDHFEAWVRPKTGQLILFPAWLMHNVRPYNGKGVRVSIAVNISSRARWEA